MGQDVVGQNFVGQDITGAISLGQEVSGAGRAISRNFQWGGVRLQSALFAWGFGAGD